MFTTIAIMILTAAAAVFAALFFSNRKAVARSESRSDGLAAELTGLREEMAKMKSSGAARMQALRKDLVMDYLKDTEGLECEYLDGNEVIVCSVGDEKFHIDTRRLPYQVIIRKGYNLDGAEVDWDIIRTVSREVADELIMIKLNADQEHGVFDYYIVSPDRTLDNFSKNFGFYLSLFRDAETRFSEKYHEYEEKDSVAGLCAGIPGAYIRPQGEPHKMKS